MRFKIPERLVIERDGDDDHLPLLNIIMRFKKYSKETALQLLKRGQQKFENLSDELRNDRDFVLKAINMQVCSLGFLPDNFRRDREIALAVVKNDGRDMQYVAELLKNDRGFILASLESGNILGLPFIADELRDDYEIIMKAVNAAGIALNYASERLKNNKDIVLAAMRNQAWSLKAASEELRSDATIILEAIKSDIRNLQFASSKLKNDYHFILQVVNMQGAALQFASKDLKQNLDIILAALNENLDAGQYISPKLKSDPHYMWYLASNMSNSNKSTLVLNPIGSFLDRHANERYFFLWDVESDTGHNKTMPMRLLTFLQYMGFNDKRKIGALYSVYPHLKRAGVSLQSLEYYFESEEDYADPFGGSRHDDDYGRHRYDSHGLIEMAENLLPFIDKLSAEELNVNAKLEVLFASDLPFEDFYYQYCQLVQGVNIFPKRQANYYLSWCYTFAYIDPNHHSIKKRITELQGFNTLLSEFQYGYKDGEDIYSKALANMIMKYPDLFTDLFYELAVNNLIPMDAVPQVVRHLGAFPELYKAYGMEYFVPNSDINYSSPTKTKCSWSEINDAKMLRQYINNSTFRGGKSELQGLRLTELSDNELRKYALETLDASIKQPSLVNIKDEYGNFKLPMQYLSYFNFEGFQYFAVLSPFGNQAFDVLDEKGTLLDGFGCRNFRFVEENKGYLQRMDQSWSLWQYNREINTLKTHALTINPLQEDNVKKEAFWQSLSEQFRENQQENIDILELVFGVNDDWNSLYLMLLVPKMEEELQENIKSQLKSALGSISDISQTFDVAFKMYNKLIESGPNIFKDKEFSPAILNVFYLCDEPNNVVIKFLSNYQNDDFFKEKQSFEAEVDWQRPLLSYLSIALLKHHENDSQGYQFHFKMHVSSAVFKQDCEGFVSDNPYTREGNLETYANQFLNYLLEKGYKRAKVYTQRFDADTISTLLDLELNPEGGFDIPEQPDIEYDDDLPF